MTDAGASEYLVYVGTYTRRTSEGIYVYRLNAATGELRDGRLVAELDNPSFLAFSPDRRFLYAVGEHDEPIGAVAAYAIDPATGDLAFLSRQPTGGPGPCHLTVDATGQMVIVTNYNGGSVAAFPVRDDGGLGEASTFIQHEGQTGPNTARQDGPHAHSVNLDADNRLAIIADLGMDRVMLYRMDPANGTLTPSDPASVSLAPGAGPRHFDWHPTRKFAYVINELGCTITAFSYDAARGSLAELQTVPSLPEGWSGSNSTADIHVSPSGEFVYGSNRGHDSIVIYRVDAATGTLTYVGHEPTGGQNPRNFAITPAGDFLLAANQDTDNIVTFAIDPASGELSPTGAVADAPMPVCLKLLPVRS
jgi:6-phosphogluconolactonase